MSRTRAPRPGVLRAVTYRRVSTAEQVEAHGGLDAQAVATRAEVERRGWTLAGEHEDAGASGKSLAGRPALAAALEALDTGRADVLVVARLDRLSRSVADFAALLDRASRKGWRVVVLDADVDTTTPSGELLVNIVAATAQYERRIIGQRTRDALAARKAAGVRLGRPSGLPADLVARIVRDRSDGASLARLADALTAENVPTAQGGVRWYPSTVRAVLRSQGAAEVAA